MKIKTFVGVALIIAILLCSVIFVIGYVQDKFKYNMFSSNTRKPEKNLTLKEIINETNPANSDNSNTTVDDTKTNYDNSSKTNDPSTTSTTNTQPRVRTQVPRSSAS